MNSRKVALLGLLKELNSPDKMLPSEKKSLIYNDFKEFVVNKEKLKTAIEKGILGYDHKFYVSHIKGDIFQEFLNMLVLTFREALTKNSETTIDFIKKWQKKNIFCYTKYFRISLFRGK